MSELTPEEQALLAALDETGDREVVVADKPRRGRKPRQVDEPAAAPADPEDPVAAPIVGSVLRGPITPIQYGGDGWGDLPVQMRG